MHESKLDGEVARNLDRDDMVSGALNTFCSVTVQCARCHNHKFDPITQEQYYGMQSIFAAVDRVDRMFDVEPKVAQRREQLLDQFANAKALQRSAEDEIAVAEGTELAELTAQIAALNKNLKPIKVMEHGYHSAIASTENSEKWVEVELKSE